MAFVVYGESECFVVFCECVVCRVVLVVYRGGVRCVVYCLRCGIGVWCTIENCEPLVYERGL